MLKPPPPRNAPGPFYVEDESCMACDAPYSEAPDLMAVDDGKGGYPCHFKKQPETPDEVECAVMACAVSCVRAVRYAGNDPEILRRFQERRSQDSCDALIGKLKVVQEFLLRQRPGESSGPPKDGSHPLWGRDLDG